MEELIAIVQFFHPLLPWKWNVFGGNKINQDDYMFYGMVFNSNCPNGELGYFTLSQLQEIEVPFGPEEDRKSNRLRRSIHPSRGWQSRLDLSLF